MEVTPYDPRLGYGVVRMFFLLQPQLQNLWYSVSTRVQLMSRAELILCCTITVYKKGFIWHVSAIYFTALAATMHTNKQGWVLF